MRILRKCLLAAGVAMLASTSVANADVTTIEAGNQHSWKQMHSSSGNCLVSFPSQPQHMQQHMPLPEENTHLKYDVYVAGMDEQVVFMVLIAEYPPSMNSAYAEQSLEAFLNGILTQNPNNRLVFADLTEVQGHKALDFFIRTQDVYFKGRAVMANNNLYLLAMECEVSHYQESKFTYFINSFQILK
ncbi:MAG: hypothetical protein MRY21_08375 [Simkaniaceae bacterium]|nr:hypothetical protein [Simkaniaceae bacterium]